MRPAVVLSLILATSPASAQRRPPRDAGPPLDAGPSPRRLVEALVGGMRVIESFGDSRGHEPGRETERPLPQVIASRCYAVVGAATGASQMRVRVSARGATVVDDTPLANSRGEAVRRDFCVRHPSDWYSLRVSSEGPTPWHISLVELPADASAPERSALVATDAPAPPPPRPPPAFREAPIGGDGYVGAQIIAYARARPRLVGLAPLARGSLATNETWTARYPFPAGRCVELVAAGVPSVRDLALEIEDPAGHRVAQDGTHRATEAVRHCPRYAGTHVVRVRMFAGAGAFAAQVLIEP